MTEKLRIDRLKTIKAQLDSAGSKADFDKLSAELERMIHAEELAHNPQMAERERKAQAVAEGRILVRRMKARVDELKALKQNYPGDSNELRKGIERAQADLEFAETQLAKLT